MKTRDVRTVRVNKLVTVKWLQHPKRLVGFHPPNFKKNSTSFTLAVSLTGKVCLFILEGEILFNQKIEVDRYVSKCL